MNEEQVINALSKVNDPDLKKDLVSLKMIKNISLNKNNLSFEIVLTTPACPLQEKIKNELKSKSDWFNKLPTNIFKETVTNYKIDILQKYYEFINFTYTEINNISNKEKTVNLHIYNNDKKELLINKHKI